MNAAAQQAQERPQNPPSETKKFGPDTYEAECQKPQERDEADLCQQWRMANAAQKQLELVALQTDLIWWQNLGNFVQGGLLIATIFLTIIAVGAARRSADTAEKTFEKTERPYLLIFDVMVARRGNPFLAYDVGNFGKNPAIIDSVEIGCALQDADVPPIPSRPNADYKLFVSNILRPDKQHDKILQPAPDPAVTVAFRNGVACFIHPPAKILLFRIVIRYHGAFTRNHETAGLWRYNQDAACFERHGGDQYNYAR